MTALDRYIRLEAAGRWRETPEAAWREVLVSFGNATLVLSSFEEEPLSHWSLAAVRRGADRGRTAVYGPDAGATEELEVDDPAMIEAIAEVSRLARGAAARPRQRWTWQWGVPLVLAGAALWAVFAGPAALRGWAFSLISPEQRAQIALQVLGALSADRCETPEGTAGLDTLAAAVSPDARVLVLGWTEPAMATLPDGTVLLARSVVEGAASAEVVAGWIAAGVLWGADGSGLGRWTEGLAPVQAARFLMSGEIAEVDIRAMARLTSATPQPADQTILDAVDLLAARGIGTSAFAAALDLPRGTEEPAATGPALLSDSDWVALQNICPL